MNDSTGLTSVPVTIKGQLEVNINDLPDQAHDLIRSGLTIPNEDRLKAQQLNQMGWWDMPESISLWRTEERRGGSTVLIMPRGYAAGLVDVMTKIGARVQWDDQRTRVLADPSYWRPFLLRDYQADATTALLSYQQGVWECPAGGGKTVGLLGFAALAGQRTLVIVDKSDLLEQWREEASEEWLNEELGIRGPGLSLDLDHPRSVGKISQGVWEERDLTIALRQALWARIDELDVTKWWKTWGLTKLDECHHAASDTLSEISRRCCSFMFVGASATPAKTETKGKIVSLMIGPVVHRTTRQELRERGILMLPNVEQIPTEFETVWVTDHTVPDNVECKVPGCKKSGKNHRHKNNYSTVLKNLKEDENRNKQIAEEIVRDRGHIHLVPSRHLNHLDRLKKAVITAGWDGPIYFLRGAENAEGHSRAIVRAIQKGGHWEFDKKANDGEGEWVQKTEPVDGVHEAVIFSTVADEALNIPVLDRVHLVFPGVQEGATIQVVGRVERVAEGKDTPLIKDYVDPLVEGLLNQAMQRERTYRKQGYPITRPLRGFKNEENHPVRFDSGDFSSFSTRWPIVIPHPFAPDEEISAHTREHLFQAKKARDRKTFDWILSAKTASEAKSRGSSKTKFTIIDGWDDGKSWDAMLSAIEDQLAQHADLRKILLDTGERLIIESRPDPIWGEGSDGRGKNLLGLCWMAARDKLRQREANRAAAETGE